MKLRVESYIILSLLLVTIIPFFYSLELGIIYLLFFLLVSLLNRLTFNWPPIFRFGLLVITVALIISYYLRPILLIHDLTFYAYSKNTSSLRLDDFFAAMYGILMNSSLFLISYVVVSGLTIGSNYLYKQHENLISKDIYRKISLKMTFLTNIIFILSLLRFILNLILGIGIKGIAITSSAAFLIRLAPEEFLVALILILLILFKKTIKKKNIVKLYLSLFFLAVAFLSTGSKALLLLILFFYLIYFIYDRKSLSIIRFITISIGIVILIPVSFYIGNAVKIAAYTNQMNISAIWDLTIRLTSESDFVESYNQVTRRFIGLDGYIANLKIHDPSLFTVFSIPNTIYRSVFMLIPFVDVEQANSGVVMGRYLSGMGEDAVHAGAVGGLASLELMFGNSLFIGVILFGAIIALSIYTINDVENEFSRFIYFFFLAYFILLAVMSGNFDFCISMLLLKILLYKIYFYPIFNIRNK